LVNWRLKHETVVFTNGCFDILHRGHVEYLALAADMGKHLIIGLNTDNSVKKLKGDNRPVQDEISRATVLASLLFVDAVILFEEETPAELIKNILPDILVKGKDYKPEEIAGYDTVIKNGGRVETVELVAGFSTTKIINKLYMQK
jgi:rfaE bifunctional protein nucleotidyltransferase chain/domain